MAGRRILIILAFLWLLFLGLVPLLLLFKLSIAQSALSIPPYTPLWDWSQGGFWPRLQIFFDNYRVLLQDGLYRAAFVNSFYNAALTTILCLFLAYPLAYLMARSRPSLQMALLFLVMIPFWTSFLLRIYALIAILKPQGFLNHILLNLGVIDAPLSILHSQSAVLIGMVYGYLPFMILPLYAVLNSVSYELEEAALVLGAKKRHVLRDVVWPLSLPGVVAGSILVFIPALGEFVIPSLLGGADSLMLGKVLWNEYFVNRDWPLASALASVMVVGFIVPVMIWVARQQWQKKNQAKNAMLSLHHNIMQRSA